MDENQVTDTGTEESTSTAPVNPLSMTDEQIMEVGTDFFADLERAESATETTEEEDVVEETEEEAEEVDVVEETEEASTEPFNDDNADTEDDAEEAESEKESSDIDYKSFYEEMTKPFKANGREMKVDNPEDAIRLMQMGANYNKKMLSLKPHLKMVKMLEKHSLLDEDKLSFLIDLDKKDPAAIKKLVKDAELDSYSLDSDDTPEYQQSNYRVDDKEVELDAVLEEIKATDTYSKTLDVVTNQWDDASRQAIANEPQVLTALNEHMANGIYDRISQVVEKEKMLGRLSGLSDIEAYRQVGDQLFSAAQQQSPAQQPAPRSTGSQSTKKTSKPETAKRKRAASTPRSTPQASNSNQDFNPLSLSDEDFEKQFSARFA